MSGTVGHLKTDHLNTKLFEVWFSNWSVFKWSVSVLCGIQMAFGIQPLFFDHWNTKLFLNSDPHCALISEHAEADCFFCFTNLMSDIRDFFIKTLDEAESGINRMMLKLMEKIKLVDPDVEEQLIAQEIKPQYFSFRYFNEVLFVLLTKKLILVSTCKYDTLSELTSLTP